MEHFRHGAWRVPVAATPNPPKPVSGGVPPPRGRRAQAAPWNTEQNRGAREYTVEPAYRMIPIPRRRDVGVRAK